MAAPVVPWSGITRRKATKVRGKLTRPTKRASLAAPLPVKAATITRPTPSIATPGSRIRPSPRVRSKSGPQTSGASARIGITRMAAAAETSTECRTAAPCFSSGITGLSPGSEEAKTIALRGRTTEASGWETIQTSEVIETVTA